MKQKTILSLLLCALLVLGALAGCAPAASEAAATAEPTAEAAQPSAGVTITDMTGRDITLAEPATRVVALSAADCEVLYAVGAGDLLVGRGEFCD